ncbi:hypothetical protein Dda_5315 [Drechslerella dactyloides]|uniref:DUF7707 domain-containing protein n=1 Tax=Drechslerella dactyloides TaxID=74499 RepID=A0AAD6J0A4_DREDA|nr:hypothetical protein Dda_5315 [Drechslerella dactyloides]
MVSSRSIALALAGLASLAAAQSTSSSSVGVGNQTIIPSSVDVNTRNGWCIAEMNTCTTLCAKNWKDNECDINKLTFNCVCADGSKPEIMNYRDTLPYFVCQAYIAQCVAANATEPKLQETCRNTNTCGNLDPAEFVPTTTLQSSRSAATSSSAPRSSGTNANAPASTTDAAAASPSTSGNAAARSLDPASVGLLHLGTIVAAFALAGFGMALHNMLTSEQRVIIDNAHLHLRLILKSIPAGSLRRIIWDSNVVFDPYIQDQIRDKHPQLAAIIHYQRPWTALPVSNNSSDMPLFQAMKNLTTIHVKSIRGPMEYRGVLSAIVRQAPLLKSLVIGFTNELMASIRNWNPQASVYEKILTCAYDMLGGVTTLMLNVNSPVALPNLEHFEAYDFPCWAEALEGSAPFPPMPVRVNPSRINHIRVAGPSEPTPIARHLRLAGVNPQILHLKVVGNEVELSDYLRQSTGLVELRINLQSRGRTDRREVNLTSHGRTLKRLFFLTHNRQGRLLSVSSRQFNQWLALPSLVEIAAVIDLDRYGCRNGHTMPSIESIWLLGANTDLALPQLNRSHRALLPGLDAQRITMVRSIIGNFFRRSTRPPVNLRFLSIGICNNFNEPTYIGELHAPVHHFPGTIRVNQRISITEVSPEVFHRHADEYSLFSMLQDSWTHVL